MLRHQPRTLHHLSKTCVAYPHHLPKILQVIHAALGEAVVGVYLFGSSLIGGLRPDSDVDLLVAINTSLTDRLRQQLVQELMRLSGDHAIDGPAPPLEVTVVKVSEVVPWRYPPRSELVYGEWLREECEANIFRPPVFDPDLALLLHTLRQDSLPLCGPSASELFDPVPRHDLRHAIAQTLPQLLEYIPGDERNCILNLARLWVVLATGKIASKDLAAQWVLEHIPERHRKVLELARCAYLGECFDNWTQHQGEVDAYVRYLTQVIRRLLAEDPRC